MPGSNQFKALGTGVGANTLTPTAYAALTSLLSGGYQTGIANSQQINTTLRQVTFAVAALAQAIADTTGAAVNDDGIVNNFRDVFLMMLQQAPYAVGTAGGSADALTLSLTPALSALTPGQTVFVRAGFANATTAPTLTVNALAAYPIAKGNNLALAVGDIAGAGHWLELQWDATFSKFMLQNPATGINPGVSSATTSYVQSYAAPKPQVASGIGQWVQFNDGVLPAGGTWAYYAMQIADDGNVINAFAVAGINAGGTTVLGGGTAGGGGGSGGNYGVAWRIA